VRTLTGVDRMAKVGAAIPRWTFYLLVTALSALSFASNGYGAERFGVRKWVGPEGPKFVPGEVIVKFRRGAEKAAIEAVHRRHGTTEIYTSKFGGFKRVRIPAGKTVEEMVAALSKEPTVQYAEPNSICHAFMQPNDPYYGYQWHLDVPLPHDETSPHYSWHGPNGGGINVQPAWDMADGAGVIVAVLDSGVAYENYNDPVSGKTFVKAPDLAQTTFVAGYDFVANDSHPNDENSHGTHVTGTIAQSTNNSLGVAGVAFKCSIMPVRVLNASGSGTAQWLADGLHFAADQGAKVINVSLGWPVTNGVPYDPGQTVRDAVAYAYTKGVTIVCASGNDGQPAVAYPAAYDDYCIAVGATRYDETRASYSNYGASLDIVAPGGDVDVDQNGDSYADGVLQNTFKPPGADRPNSPPDPTVFSYWFFDGTSMATPHVAGVAALVISLGINSPSQVRSILQSTAEDKGATGRDQYYGYGIVDAYAATLAAGGQPRPTALNDTATTNQDTSVIIDVLANDTDPNNKPLIITNLTQPSNGTATLSVDNKTVTYTPNPGFHGTDTFTYTANNGTVDSNVATVTVTVLNPLNVAPVAQGDTYYVAKGGVLTVYAPGVLANDTDADGDPLTAILVSGPDKGTLTFNSNGSFTYTPNNPGQSFFTYKANDGRLDSDTVTVNLNVHAGNVAPAARKDAYNVGVNGSLSISAVEGVLANDTDNDYDTLTATLVSNVSYGTLVLNGDGSLNYTPPFGFQSTDSFTYYARDGKDVSATRTVTITVLPNYAYRIPDVELLNEANDPDAFVKLDGWSGSSSTLLERTALAAGGVVYRIRLEGAENGKIVVGDPWPTSSDAGFAWDYGLDHATSLPAYGCYEMVVYYRSGPAEHINVCLFLNTGLTGPSGYPSSDSTNDTYWDSDWTTISLGQQVTLRLDLNNARANNISDNKVPHTGGGKGLANWSRYAINNRDRQEISNIGIQIADFDGYESGTEIEIELNGPAPTAAQVQLKGARVEDGQVVVEWDTASEVGTAGFYVTRREGAGGEAKLVGEGLLPGLLHRPQGGTYRVVDPDVQEGQTYTYDVLEVEAGGAKRACGSCQVTVANLAAGRWEVAGPRQEPSGPAYSKAPRTRSAPGVVGAIPARRAAAGKTPVRARARAAGQAVKIGVKENGLYYLAAEDLAPLFAGSARSVARLIELGHFSLACRGEPVAYLPAEGGVGLYFYGQAIDSIYTDENVYWLRFGLGDLMAETGESGVQPAAAAQTFTEAVHAEEDRYPATGLFRDPEGDFWLWDYVVSGQRGADRKSFTVRADGAALTGSAALTVHLKGATSTKAQPDHHARVFLNGAAVGETWWDGLGAQSLTLPVSGALLVPGANTVTVEGILDTGAPYSIFYVDSFDLAYERLYEARGDALLCPMAGHGVVTIGGFTQPQVIVLDVSTPRKPRHVIGATVEEAAGGYRVSFASPGPDSTCLAVTPQAAKRPVSLLTDEPSELMDRGKRAGYVLIAPAELKEAAQALAAYRAGQGLAAMVVMLEDIYDEFNHGIADPHAIQAFLAHACGSWRRGPKYVVLAGRGTYDYKNYLGYGDNLVPALLKSTAYGLFVADRQFAPQLAIGRLPATGAAEFDALVQKIIAYERSSGSWTKQVVMAADNADGGGDFPRDSDELARSIPPGYSVSKAYLSSAPLSVVRGQLRQGFLDGALLVNYLGHGGMDRLAQEGLLTRNDAAALNNGDRLPVVTALSCVAGRFDVPGYECLGEALVLQPDGGAVAFLGPSGLLLNGQSKVLGEGFLQASLRPGNRVLGDAVADALRYAGGRCSSAGALEVYNLLGDPALKLRPAEPAAEPGPRDPDPKATAGGNR